MNLQRSTVLSLSAKRPFRAKISIGLAVMAMLTVALVQAAAQPSEEAVLATVKQRISAAIPHVTITDVRPSEMPGLYEAQVINGPIIYSNASGSHFITGDLYKVVGDGIVNLAEERRASERKEKIAAVKPANMIIFKPEVTKAVVSVFTDVDCGYCQKLHKEVPELNKLGVEVRYLAFPRAGVGSPAANKLVSAWCAADPKDALTKLKNRQQIPSKSCINPIAAQYELGQALGVTGTPALITDDGQLFPGYMPAAVLAERLGLKI